MKKRRQPIKAEVKHLLMDECESACAECRETASSKLEYHHIDGDRSRSVFENLLVLCANCHSEFSRGSKSESDALLLKRMAEAGKLAPRKGATSSAVNVNHNEGVVAQNVENVTIKVSGGKKAPDLVGTIGANPGMRTYANYLAGRYIDWRKKSDDFQIRRGRKIRKFSPGATHRVLGEGFGVTNSLFQISESRFHEWVSVAQAKIDRTIWGKQNKHRNYHTWEEHLQERHG